MRHEKIISRLDGSKVSIEVSVRIDFTKGASYNISVFTCAVGKRKYHRLCQDDDHSWRALSMEDRDKSDHLFILKHVTEDELYAAKVELWAKLKPKK